MKKKENKFPSYVLYDGDDYSRDFFEEDCAEMGEDCCYDVNSDNDYYDWLSHMRERDFEDVFDNLRFSKNNNMCCVIEGSVGTWRGSFPIYPIFFSNLSSALKKCCHNADLSYLKVSVENGRIEVSSPHHDGTNHFTISLLSAKGEKDFLNSGNFNYGVAYDIEITKFQKKRFEGYLF